MMSRSPGPPPASDPLRVGATARILDANLNRSAEALRVVEDVVRFHWELPGFSSELKTLRHALLELFLPDPRQRRELVAHRDIEGDPGTRIRSPASSRGPGGEEGDRDPALEVTAVRNLERLKESLRSIEEVCRPRAPGQADEVERIRYRVYALEKGLLHLSSGTRDLDGRVLYLLWTESLVAGPPGEVLDGALEGGVSMVQLREKDIDDRNILERGRWLREKTARAGVPLIVNDRADLARLLHADGLHLGQYDMPVALARRLVGPTLLIGVSTHSLEQARAAVREGADYIGVGPIFPTRTKTTSGPVLDREVSRKILEEVPIPAFAIGGIRADNLVDVVARGAHRVAVSSALLGCSSRAEARLTAEALSPTRGPAGP